MTDPCLTITTHACPDIERLLDMIAEAMSKISETHGFRAFAQDILYRSGGIWREQVRDGLFEDPSRDRPWHRNMLLSMEIDGGMAAALAVLILQSADVANRALNILSGEFAQGRDGETETTAFFFPRGILVVPGDSFRVEAMPRSGEPEILGRMLVPESAASQHGRMASMQGARLAARAMEGLLARTDGPPVTITCREGAPI